MSLQGKKMNRLFPLITLFLLLSACATSTPENTFDEASNDNPNVKFKILAQGIHSNISLVNQMVIRTQKDWMQLLKIHASTNAASLPTIDFSNNIVIVIFAGQQPSGGYSVGVSNIKRADDNLFVSVTFTEPKAGSTVTLALTQPYIFLVTEKVDGKILFLAKKK